MDCLSAHDLVFSVTIDPSEADPWRPIHQALVEQLGRSKYSLKFYDNDLGGQFTRLSWDILAQKKPNKKGKATKYLFEPGLVGPGSFTFKFLSDQAFDPEMESPNNGHLFILISSSRLLPGNSTPVDCGLQARDWSTSKALFWTGHALRSLMHVFHGAYLPHTSGGLRKSTLNV